MGYQHLLKKTSNYSNLIIFLNHEKNNNFSHFPCI